MGESLDNASGLLAEQRAGDRGRYQFSAATRPGFSGAPVFIDGKVVGLLTGGTDGRLTTANQSMFSPLKAIRGNILGECAAKCRHSSHGLEGYSNFERWTVKSGWLAAPAGAVQYCQARQEERRRQFPERKISIMEMDETIVLRIWTKTHTNINVFCPSNGEKYTKKNIVNFVRSRLVASCRVS